MSDQPHPGRARGLKLIALLGALGAAAVIALVLPDEQSHHSAAPEPAATTTLSALTTASTAAPTTAPMAASTTAVTAAKPAARGPARAPARTASDPGTLPQTTAFPPSTGARFDSEMSALWLGVMTGTVPPARPAFFPESAYLQVKGIGDPGADYVNRLLGEFSEDLAAAHALLGPAATEARLLAVDVPSQYGHWVEPGICDNRVGYFEVPNSRLVYRDSEGQVHSFGIASLISWRGVWYVVHLGAVVRSSGGGVVDDPELGPGTPAYSSTC